MVNLFQFRLLAISIFLFSLKSFSLPVCPDDPTKAWDMCSGSYLYDGGEMYSGEWKDNLYHGEGVFFYSNGDRFIGFFEKDIPHGHGTYSYRSGDLYVGKWVEGKRQGKGSYAHRINEWENDLYVGDFIEDKKEGVGIYTYSDGVKYIGEFKDDVKHGKGKYLYLNGESEEIECFMDSCKAIVSLPDTGEFKIKRPNR